MEDHFDYMIEYGSIEMDETVTEIDYGYLEDFDEDGFECENLNDNWDCDMSS